LSTAITKNAYDVVIVGGAAVGSSTAYFLACNPDFDGSVLVVERDWTYAKSATALSSSSIRHQFSNPINVLISQFGTAFIRDFKTLAGGEAPDLAFKESGYLFLAGDAAAAGILSRNHQVQKSCGADTVLLSPDELRARFPWLNADGLELGSLGLSGEGWFDNHGFLLGLRRAARMRGVGYVEDEVIGIRRENGRTTGVRLKSGEDIGCGTIINAAGTRGPRIAAMAGLSLPVEPRRRSLFVFSCQTPLGGKVPLTVDPTGVFFRPEGQFYLAGTTPKSDDEVDVEDFEVMHAEFEDEIWPVLAERVPAFEAIKVVNAWAGHYDYCTLDQNVIVGPHPQIGNFLLANGFSGHGLQQSPAVGRALSELVVYGAYRTLDLSPLGYGRVAANRPFSETSII
jgi:glycine/D-amino acid oxidase-like deaminating enzyme